MTSWLAGRRRVELRSEWGGAHKGEIAIRPRGKTGTQQRFELPQRIINRIKKADKGEHELLQIGGDGAVRIKRRRVPIAWPEERELRLQVR